MQFAFRSPKFPLLFDAGSTLLFARSKAQLATRVSKLELTSKERREIIDATGEGFCMYAGSMNVAPSIAMRRWTKTKIIDLYNSRRSPGAPEMRSTSLGSRSLAQIVSEAVELLAQQPPAASRPKVEDSVSPPQNEA